MNRPRYSFFFSSRRRHTRCLSDWSSDVCSSDLIGSLPPPLAAFFTAAAFSGAIKENRTRSEERRVGKECRSRRSPYHSKKKKGRKRITDPSDYNTLICMVEIDREAKKTEDRVRR